MDRKQRLIAGGVAVFVVAGIVLVPQALDDDDGKTERATGGEPAGTIVADGLRYRPRTTTVAEGRDMRFRNDDDVAHTFTADDGLFDSGTIQPGDEYRFAFDGPREVTFHCEIHPSMKGTIEVDG